MHRETICNNKREVRPCLWNTPEHRYARVLKGWSGLGVAPGEKLLGIFLPMAPDLRLCFATSLGVRKVTYQDMIQHKRRECEGTDRAIRHAFACTVYASRLALRESGEERTKAGGQVNRHAFAKHLPDPCIVNGLARRRKCKALKTGIRHAFAVVTAMGTRQCRGAGKIP